MEQVPALVPPARVACAAVLVQPLGLELAVMWVPVLVVLVLGPRLLPAGLRPGVTR